MLHFGYRNVGNKIGTSFIEIAKEDMVSTYGSKVPLDKDISYLRKGTKFFAQYWFAVKWAQQYASLNLEIMMRK
jgi:tRNA-splicing ligase RtcB